VANELRAQKTQIEGRDGCCQSKEWKRPPCRSSPDSSTGPGTRSAGVRIRVCACGLQFQPLHAKRVDHAESALERDLPQRTDWAKCQQSNKRYPARWRRALFSNLIV
jgi:hypothetical protein